MGTYLLGTIYDVIAHFLLEMGTMSRIENDQHEICFVSVFFASLQRHFYGFYGFLNLYFFPKVSLHF